MSYLNESENSNVAYRNGQQGSDTSNNIMKSIDLFTGTVKFPLSLCYLEGRDGLSITVQANYIQNNPNNYHKENRKLNNSILGYGWNMGLPAIVSKNRLVKQGYQRDFYLSEGGKYPLYRTGRDGDHIQFFSVEQPNWKFYFYDQEEETYWEIIKEDGSKYKYGGSKDSNELTVCWDNWVGPSTMNGAENFTTSWYLSMVESSKGSKIIYEYDNIMENLADSNYTRTIRLRKIISSYQQEIVFCYEDKSKEEYGINHGLYDKENPYQEKYEDKFLDKIQVFNYNKKLLYTQKLSYDLKQSGNNELKRFLTDIAQINSDGKVMPPLSLNYSENEEFLGILNKVNYPLSSEIEYDYKKFQFPKSHGYQSFYIDQNWDYKVYSGNDFNFMILNRDNYIKLKIYYWDMGWHEYEDNSINEIPVEDIKVNLGVGYVCITYKNLLDNNYKLKIIKRSPVKKFQWDSEDFTIENTDSKPTIACGSDFIAIQCKMENTLKILQYKYTDNKWHENKLYVESRDFNGLGAGDGFLFGAYGDDNSNNVRIMSFYSDEDHNWRFGDFIDISVDVDWNLILKDYIWSISYSQAGTCFITHNNNEIKTTLILLSWTDKFKFTKHETHNFSYDDSIKNQYFYTVTTDTMIGYGENVYRYSPNGWEYYKILNPIEGGEYRYSYGSDIALAVENINGVQKFYSISFDPYTQQWSDQDIPKSEDLYNIEGTCQPLIVDEYVVLGRSIFTRGKENTWNNIGFLEEQTDYSNIQIDSEGKYLLYQLQGINRVYQVPLKITV